MVAWFVVSYVVELYLLMVFTLTMANARPDSLGYAR